MFAIRLLNLAAALLLIGVYQAYAQAPLPSYPLYCQGPLTTGAHSPPPSGPTLTPFKWTNTGAGAQAPGPGECAWADRGVRPEEIVESVSPHGNAICDNSGNVADLAAGKYLEVGVYRDPAKNNCMHLTHYIGGVSPPFSAAPALPPFVRQSIASLTPSQITALRHGFQVMMSRPASNPTSYRFQANIHGTYDTTTTAQETEAWNQCEHGSFYFFSWHRMYLYFLERLVRAASGDPKLALPYWNWSDSSQRALPAAFRSPGNSSNPLYVSQRAPGMNGGTALLPASAVSFSVAFGYTNFDSPTGSGLSFGGQIAGPMQFNAPHGELESQPHDVVHVVIGGNSGLMSDPDTAAQDPIFWLHHANIDRLWKRWLDQGGGRQDPLSDAAWMNTKFTFFDENATAVTLTGQQIIDTVGSMNYRYDDDPTTKVEPKMEPQPRVAMALAAPSVKTLAVTATDSGIKLADEPVTVSLPLQETAATQLKTMAAQATLDQKIILQLDNIQYEGAPGHYYEVYLNLPQGQPANPESPYFVGTLSFFALKPHHMAGHAGGAAAPDIKRDYDVTNIVRGLSQSGGLNEKEVSVTLVPRGAVDADQKPLAVTPGVTGSIGKITLATQ